MTDNAPAILRRDRKKGFSADNVEIVSTKARHLGDNYTKHELELRIKSNSPVPGYSMDEMQKMADWLIN